MINQFNELVHLIYEGATDVAAWPRTIAALANHLEAEKALLLTPFDPPGKGGFGFPHAISQQHLALWKSRFLPEDLWARRVTERNLAYEGNVVLGHDLVTDQELLDSPWYSQFLSTLDVFHLLTGIVFTTGRADLPFTTSSFFRSANSPAFEETHREKLRLLVPHISRALGVMFQLRDAEFRIASSLQALNRINHGILLLDDKGAVCFANTAAERILQQQDGLRLGDHVGGHRLLRADDPLGEPALARALDSTLRTLEADAKHFAETVLIRRPSGSTSYAVQVSHLPETNPYRLGAAAVPRAVVFIKDGTLVSQPEPGFLQKMYGLTQAEARAALALCDGGSLDAVATQLNVKLNTLKTHLKSIYTKTSVDNRASLTKLMLSLANG